MIKKIQRFRNHLRRSESTDSILNQKWLTTKFIGISLAVAAFIFGGVHLFYQDLNGTLFLASMLLLDLFVLFFIFKSNKTLAAHLFTAILAATVIYFYISLGGAILTWFPMISFIALLGIGVKAGFTWLMITLILQTLLFIFPINSEVLFPQFWSQLAEEYKHFDNYIVAVGGMIIITFLMMYVEFSRNSAFSELIKIRKNLEKQVQQEVKKHMALVHAHEEEMENTQKELIMTMSTVLETRSSETGYHVQRVCEYSELLAKLCGLTKHEQQLIFIASSMHDIGKAVIPDEILNKPGRYTEEEFTIMQQHTTIGYQMLKDSERPIIKNAAAIALNHHEWWNGDGYPNNLHSEDIPLYARIVAISDVFDALGSDRVYKKAWPLEKILAHFEELSGVQFDPNLVHIFLTNIDDFVVIRNRLVD